MGDENHICTLGDYSKPSHEGYRNTIELLVGNNVSEDPNQHLKDFLELVDSLDLDVQIFYDLIDHTLKWIVVYAAGGRLRKLSAEKAWAIIEELARYEDDGWNDLVATGEGSLDYENPNIKQLLGVMELYQLPSKPSRQEEFENLVMKFILDQEEKVKKLEEYMGVIESDFLQLSLEVVGKLKEEIRMEKIESKRSRRSQEPLDETPLEDLSLNTCNHDIPLSSREIPNFDEPGPQPQPLLNYPPLDVIFDEKKLGSS
uniref:MAK10-like protein n=1 Tax=Tanacetum cinerariifolium TaxID=118510 RepID=A0A6L2JKP6_TANCI|nr:MAK10-like protein [Tanacetum cinerariifolium]